MTFKREIKFRSGERTRTDVTASAQTTAHSVVIAKDWEEKNQ